jgi:hypothetical protein
MPPHTKKDFLVGKCAQLYRQHEGKLGITLLGSFVAVLHKGLGISLLKSLATVLIPTIIAFVGMSTYTFRHLTGQNWGRIYARIIPDSSSDYNFDIHPMNIIPCIQREDA